MLKLLRLLFGDFDQVLDSVDHAPDGWGVVVDGNIIRTTESERLDGALVVLERIVDAASLLDVELLCRHCRIRKLS